MDADNLEINRTAGMVTIKQAAKRLKVGRARVQQFIEDGRLRAHKDSLSGWYLIDPTDLASFSKIPRNPGRKPKKSA